MYEKPQYRSIGMGYVAENKPRNTHEVRIWLAEVLPTLNNELQSGSETREKTSVDNDGNTVNIKMDLSTTSTATWKGCTNRATSPDVRRGERVEVFRLGDSDVYYWDSLGMDDHLRRLETAVFNLSGNPNNDNTNPSQDDNYYLEVSTHDKHITLHTSKANGEPFGYTMQLDTEKGTYTLEDDLGNYLHLNTGDKHWRWENADGSFMELNKKNIAIHAPKTIDVTFNTCNMSGKQLNITVPDINITGDIKHAGSNTQTGDYTVTGQVTVTGPVNITGATSIVGGATIDTLLVAALAAGGPGGTPSTFSGPISTVSVVNAKQFNKI